MGQIQSHTDLEVWQLAMSLVEDCYRFTVSFPREEIFGMTSQIRRCAVSIPANIAEGFGRDQSGYFIQFLRIAMGSARELETHLLLTERLNLASVDLDRPLLDRCVRVSKMLRALIRSLEARTEN
ncbi:MAG: four helix bundle protein [Hyphomicrobium sp.]